MTDLQFVHLVARCLWLE